MSSKSRKPSSSSSSPSATLQCPVLSHCRGSRDIQVWLNSTERRKTWPAPHCLLVSFPVGSPVRKANQELDNGWERVLHHSHFTASGSIKQDWGDVCCPVWKHYVGAVGMHYWRKLQSFFHSSKKKNLEPPLKALLRGWPGWSKNKVQGAVPHLDSRYFSSGTLGCCLSS